MAWDKQAFIQALTASQIATQNFYDYFGKVANGIEGNCGYFWSLYAGWENQPGFTDVPGDWYPLYYRYRNTLEGLRGTVTAISQICGAGGGHVDSETDQKILTDTQAAINAFQEMFGEAQSR